MRMKLMNIPRKVNDKIKNIFNSADDFSGNDLNPYILLEIKNNKLIAKVNEDINDVSVLIIHRLTRKSIEKDIQSKKAIFSLDEIVQLGSIGFLDLYFKFSDELVRVKSKDKKQFAHVFKNYHVFESHTTRFQNLSLFLHTTDFNYDVTSVNLNDDDIVISGNFDFVKDENNLEFFIEIRNRWTGKKLNQIIKSNEVTFSLNELLDMDDSPFYDVYFKSKAGSNVQRKRVPYKDDFQFVKSISPGTNSIFKVVSTKNKNLSFKQEIRDFDLDITNIEENQSKLLIEGELEIINSDISQITHMNVVSKSRSDNDIHLFDLNFTKKGDKYYFKALIDEIVNDEEPILNLRLDFYLRVYDDDIYYESPIDLTDFKPFIKREDKFLVKFNTENNVYAYYASENNHFLSLWITTESSWRRSYEIIKGKTIYDETSLKFDLNPKMVFFESFFGKSYAGNPKYIYEKMLELGLDKEFTFVWAYSGENKEKIPGNPIIVDRYSAGDYYKYLAQAKYWVNNIIFPIHKKRAGNVYLQTWHGTPLKKLGFDITIPGPEVDARENFYIESRNWDYLISSNEYSSEIFERAFKYKNEILEDGYPINDIFFKDNSDFIASFKSKLKIDSSKKVILYAPTWKDDEQTESWQHYFDLQIDLERLFNEFKEEYVILLKMHHLVSDNIKIDDRFRGFVFDVSDYDDIQELYVLSDILITDYSSVFFDYAHSKKPILFFVPDLFHYINNVRGLYLNMEKDLPGPLIKDNNELINAIKNIENVQKDFESKYEEFYDRYCSLCNGHSSEDIIMKVFKWD